MKLVRLCSLSHKEMAKIRERQRSGTMQTYYDKDNYICYDNDELATYKPRKSGRPPIKGEENGKRNNRKTNQ